MDFHFGKETSISYISPCSFAFFACCLLRELGYRLSTPPPQPRPPLRSLHNVLETSFLSLIQNSHQEIGIFYMIMDFGK